MEEPRGPRVARDPGRTRSRDCRRGRGAADARHHAPAGVGVVKLATGKGKQKHSTLAPPTLQTADTHCTLLYSLVHISEAAAVMS